MLESNWQRVKIYLNCKIKGESERESTWNGRGMKLRLFFFTVKLRENYYKKLFKKKGKISVKSRSRWKESNIRKIEWFSFFIFYFSTRTQYIDNALLQRVWWNTFCWILHWAFHIKISTKIFTAKGCRRSGK